MNRFSTRVVPNFKYSKTVFRLCWSCCNGRKVSSLDSQLKDSQLQDRSLSRVSRLAYQKPSREGYGCWQRCLSSLSHKLVPGYRDGICTWITCGALKCITGVYSPGSSAGGGCHGSARGNSMQSALSYLWQEKALDKKCILWLLLELAHQQVPNETDYWIFSEFVVQNILPIATHGSNILW